MKPLVLDVETTTFKRGHVFSQRNKLCFVGTRSATVNSQLAFEYSDRPYGESVATLRRQFDDHDLLIAFNAKFDINWIRRYGIKTKLPLWDLQLAEFILTGQETPFPSLQNTCARCGIAGKSDDMDALYWSKGIDTDQIEESVLRAYVKGDCEAEWNLFGWQMDYLKDKPLLKRLIWNACQDTLITAEMEWHGIFFNIEKSKQLGDKLLSEINVIDCNLNEICGRDDLNWNSNDTLSVLLYGGTLERDVRQVVPFHYKDGRVTDKLRWTTNRETFTRLVEPLKGTEVKKPGFFQVNEDVLHKLKASGKAKQIINLVLERNKIEKQVSTYYLGWPKLYEEMEWQNGIIHGSLLHTRAKTGRLSSAKPNLQNTDKGIRECIITRFPVTMTT